MLVRWLFTYTTILTMPSATLRIASASITASYLVMASPPFCTRVHSEAGCESAQFLHYNVIIANLSKCVKYKNEKAVGECSGCLFSCKGETSMRTFFRAAAIRAVKTVAQTAVSLISVGTFMSDINWTQVASASLLAGVLSVLTSIATGLPEVDGDAK